MTMTTTDFSTTALVDGSPGDVFKAITNVRGWWSQQIDGGTTHVNDEFHYQYRDVHACRIKLVEVIHDTKIVWEVLDNYFSFTQDKSEWKGTKMVFAIARKGAQTELTFTHLGLVPAFECFEVCRDGWTHYIQGSLKNLIATGEGQPNPKEGGFNEELVKKWKLN